MPLQGLLSAAQKERLRQWTFLDGHTTVRERARRAESRKARARAPSRSSKRQAAARATEQDHATKPEGTLRSSSIRATGHMPHRSSCKIPHKHTRVEHPQHTLRPSKARLSSGMDSIKPQQPVSTRVPPGSVRTVELIQLKFLHNCRLAPAAESWPCSEALQHERRAPSAGGTRQAPAHSSAAQHPGSQEEKGCVCHLEQRHAPARVTRALCG